MPPEFLKIVKLDGILELKEKVASLMLSLHVQMKKRGLHDRTPSVRAIQYLCRDRSLNCTLARTHPIHVQFSSPALCTNARKGPELSTSSLHNKVKV